MRVPPYRRASLTEGRDAWPTPPIWPDDLDGIPELLTEEEWEELLRTHWSPWPLETTQQAESPERGGDARGHSVSVDWCGSVRRFCSTN